MSTRQASCELEIDPSLQVKPAGAASTTGAGFSEATACWGVATCAAGFWKRAQPVHERQINKTRPNRIFVASRQLLQRPITGSVCSGLRRLQRTTTGLDSHTWRRLGSPTIAIPACHSAKQVCGEIGLEFAGRPRVPARRPTGLIKD
jgi:hypothetical protein